VSDSPRQARIAEALSVLNALGLPRAQRNERSALCLLALCDLPPDTAWEQAQAPLLGVTPLMDWARRHYAKAYAPNTRETVRRQTLHQFVAAGIALYNPDDPARPVNSPKAVYQIEPHTLTLLRSFGARPWADNLARYLEKRETLAGRYARERRMRRIPVMLAGNREIRISPGKHSRLIKAVIEDFASRFAPGSVLLYAGDTGSKWGYFDEKACTDLGVSVDVHGKMPDVVFHHVAKGWLILVEAVTSHGPMDAKRHEELAALFAGAKAGLVFVTAFPDKASMARYLGEIAWETEVWVAESPSHLIHFNGERFLGPYSKA
jgi:type II restriction enzyme